ncbi:IclR family transcriptional regulator [Paenarthrobacter sp. NPDC057981]|uniref:IclR family transcriptional regulator n=1 Tax=Paenarthrobacter sp. NPDC057981 TaxID=3346297 RepID=UPI0036DEF552
MDQQSIIWIAMKITTNSTPVGSLPDKAPEERVVGSDRVLAVLVELANHPDGIGLEEMARTVNSPKATVHRALASLRRAGLAGQLDRGRYVLGDEFLRMAFANHEARPDHVRVRPILEALTARFGETAHYAVLEGESIVYRGKVDPSVGAMKLTSTVGGRNPAHSTGVGKLMLSYDLLTEDSVTEWIGKRTLTKRTDRTVVTAQELHTELNMIRRQGYSIDDRENESDVNCIAFPAFFGSPSRPTGGISISAIAHRTPLKVLVDSIPAIQKILGGDFDRI